MNKRWYSCYPDMAIALVAAFFMFISAKFAIVFGEFIYFVILQSPAGEWTKLFFTLGIWLLFFTILVTTLLYCLKHFWAWFALTIFLTTLSGFTGAYHYSFSVDLMWAAFLSVYFFMAIVPLAVVIFFVRRKLEKSEQLLQ